ncbi:penicillin-binding protein, partial [Bordetella pertussis]
WMGFDQPRSLGTNEFGSGLALSTWLDYEQPTLKGTPQAPRAPRPQGLIVDNGEYYFSEFPPGQAVAALDLSSGDELTDFLNNMRPSDGAPARVQQPGQPPAGSSSGGQPPIPPIPVPRADLPDGQATPASLPLGR